jgi:hypothetical protein
MNRPKITVTPVPHIKRVDLLRDLSLRQIQSLDKHLEDCGCECPKVDGLGECFPWDFERWRREAENS